MDWIYKGQPISELPENVVGFVYCITNNNTNRQYIGKKTTFTRRRKKVAGRVNRKIIIKESDWKNYWGSSDILLEDVDLLGEEHFTREILQFFKTKKETSYAELEEQVKRDVLRAKMSDGTPSYYNYNILGKWFPKDLR